jgi:hypothetical protein
MGSGFGAFFFAALCAAIRRQEEHVGLSPVFMKSELSISLPQTVMSSNFEFRRWMTLIFF